VVDRDKGSKYMAMEMICVAWGGEVIEIVNGRRI